MPYKPPNPVGNLKMTESYNCHQMNDRVFAHFSHQLKPQKAPSNLFATWKSTQPAAVYDFFTHTTNDVHFACRFHG